jgi:dTDP-4-dehydrorhamnose 3,5-epimerase
MEVIATSLPDVVEIVPVRHGDDRGWFSEVWNEKALAEAGVALDWVQDNEAMSAKVGTIRGLHFQLPPFAQDKLVRALRGRIVDVAVDIRQSSPTFGHHVAVELTAAKGNQLLVPKGFAHGYCTLEPDSVIAYKVSNYYAPESDRSLRWDDPALGINWPVDGTEASLSAKDLAAPLLADLDSLFD